MNILAVGPHPDDVEFGCAPLLIQESRKGHRIRILVTSKGEAATSGAPEERANEAAAAARIIGAEIGFIDLGGDCHVEHSPANSIAMAREIRLFRPDVVLAPSLEENQHPDHSAVGRIVRDAARLARYGGLQELRDLPSHPIGHLYYYRITQIFGTDPDLVIDVSAVEAEWLDAMKCHKTQMKTRAYPDLVLARARALGAAMGTPCAIGLWANDPIRLESLSDLKLSSRNY
ncbi:MAG TPA: PIG-L family deacetylase [Bryobacteraceae bacterium]|nr:PIG-L family deacetylase [Bryobacteraceae bacterium]